MTTSHAATYPSLNKASAAAGTALIALVTLADTQFQRFDWSADSLGPAPRSLALGLIWIGGAIYVRLHRRTWASQRLPTSVLLLLAFLVVALASSLDAPDPSRSVLVWVGLSIVVLLTLAVVSANGPDAVLWGILIGTASISAVSVTQWVVDNTASPGTRFAGIAFEANLLGQLSGLGLIVAATLFVRHRLDPTLFAAVAGITIWAAYLSGTRSTAPALAAAAVVAVGRKRPLIVLATTAFVVALVVGFGGGAIAEKAQRTDAEDLSLLSGRTELWSWSIEQSQERPILGYGLGSAEAMFADARTEGRFDVASASSHNLPLEIVRETGLLGLLLLTASALGSRFWQNPSARPMVMFLAVSGLTMPTSGVPGLVTIAWVLGIAWPLDPILLSSRPRLHNRSRSRSMTRFSLSNV